MQSFELYNYYIPTFLIIIYDGLYYPGRLNRRWFKVGQPSAMTVNNYLSTAWTLFAVARGFIEK